MMPSSEPLPYWIANSVPLGRKLEDFSESKRRWRKQAIELQWVEGTQKLDEPVSKTTEKV